MPDPKQRVRFHYIKSNLYRVAHVDGIHGGPTPQGGVFIGVFSERLPIPESSVHEFKDGGILGDEIKEERKSKDGIVREVEIGLEMNLEVAEQIHGWLGEVIKRLRNAKTEVGSLEE